MTEPNVRQLSPEVEALSSVWPMLSALMGGTRAMRAAGKIYLPQFPNEDDAAYRLRLAGATLHPVFKRTVRVDAARPFAKPPVVEDVPDRVLPWLGDVDLQGSSLAAFGLSLMTSCLSHGLSGVLVDGPKVEGVVTAADEVRAGLRPYLSAYAAQNILGWKLGRLSQGYGLTQVRLLESVAEDDGAFGSKTVEQVRVLTPGAWQVWRATGLNDEWAVVDEGETRLETSHSFSFTAFAPVSAAASRLCWNWPTRISNIISRARISRISSTSPACRSCLPRSSVMPS